MTSDFSSTFEKRMNSIFEDKLIDDFAHCELVPLSHFTEKDSKWVLEVDLPGVKKKNVKVTLTHNHIVITAKLEESYRVSRHGRITEFNYFKKVVPIPPHADTKNIICEFMHGILTIIIPKITTGKKIPIK